MGNQPRKRWESVAVQGELEIDSHMSVSAGITVFEGATRIVGRLRDAFFRNATSPSAGM
jgi:hypothetical protein